MTNVFTQHDLPFPSLILLLYVAHFTTCYSISHFIGPLVSRSVGSMFTLLAFASIFRITTPQLHATDAVMYTTLLLNDACGNIGQLLARLFVRSLVVKWRRGHALI